jgi:glycosyltransferase involved in cell wall biosynthesis
MGAVPAGLRLIRKLKPEALWSTYPIATAHFVAYTLHRITSIPWVADFRDPMVESGYPSNPMERAAYERIEGLTVKHCKRAVFASSGALRLCAERYPDIPQARLTIIENGYDEPSFAAAEHAAGHGRLSGGAAVLVHSGIIYPSERDPRAFFAALSELCRNGTISRGQLKVVLRATGNDDYLRGLIGRDGIEGIVSLEPSLPYQEALAEMISADALLVLQAANCNNQVPAKLYEYLRARRPIIALTDPAGDTAAVLRCAGIDTIARLDSQEQISRLLVRFLELLRLQRAPVASEAAIAAASRRSRTKELASLLDALA